MVSVRHLKLAKQFSEGFDTYGCCPLAQHSPCIALKECFLCPLRLKSETFPWKFNDLELKTMLSCTENYRKMLWSSQQDNISLVHFKCEAGSNYSLASLLNTSYISLLSVESVGDLKCISHQLLRYIGFLGCKISCYKT